MKNENTQKLAERIARILESEADTMNLHSIQASLEKINGRLDVIESQVALQNTVPHSALRTPRSNHPSQEQFLNLEEIADEIIGNLQNEKACPYEPTGKPCDHCAMCNSRGF